MTLMYLQRMSYTQIYFFVVDILIVINIRTINCKNCHIDQNVTVGNTSKNNMKYT
jgi:hypothetical protein